MNWRTFSGERIQIPVNERVEQLIIRETDAGHNLKVCIGSDSQVRGNSVDFATVIVFLREGKGGFMLISNSSERNRYSLKERMLMEVSKSIDIAYKLCDVLDKHGVELEVHADINTDPNFKSNPALKEAMGYILSMGFQFRAKPDAFASSSCADKMV